METAQMPFSERLKQLREESGLSQAELAEASGLGVKHISKLERGERHPTFATAVALAKALGVSVAAFVDGEAESS